MGKRLLFKPYVQLYLRRSVQLVYFENISSFINRVKQIHFNGFNVSFEITQKKSCIHEAE